MPGGLTNNLPAIATSDPRYSRFWLSWWDKDECHLDIFACADIGDLTYNIQGETTTSLCYNHRTRKDEVVAIIRGNADQSITFDLSRFLPREYVSLLLQLIKKNCGVNGGFLRGDQCSNPFDVNDFAVLTHLGALDFTGAYNLTSLVSKNQDGAADVMESVQVTAYSYYEVARQTWATRGGATTEPIVDIKICDSLSCGGICEKDSDGCQTMFYVTEAGNLWYTQDQLETEYLSGQVTNYVDETIQGLCCVSDQVVVIGSGGAANVGKLWVADQKSIVDGEVITWNEITQSKLGIDYTDLPNISACQADSGGFLWVVGEDGFVGQYDPARGIVTVVTAIPNIVEDYLWVSIQGSVILIGGTNGTLIYSSDGGRSFEEIEVIDPDTALPIAAIDLTSGDIVNDWIWEVGTADGRFLYTVDRGDTWYEQIKPSSLTGAPISDIHFHNDTGVGFATTEDGNILKTYYGVCGEWLLMPENDNTLPANNGMNALAVCSFDPNIAVAAGESVGGAGIIMLGTTTSV